MAQAPFDLFYKETSADSGNLTRTHALNIIRILHVYLPHRGQHRVVWANPSHHVLSPYSFSRAIRTVDLSLLSLGFHVNAQVVPKSNC